MRSDREEILLIECCKLRLFNDIQDDILTANDSR